MATRRLIFIALEEDDQSQQIELKIFTTQKNGALVRFDTLTKCARNIIVTRQRRSCNIP
jgi:hypothetical protein